ncbi:MAG: aminotransferase class I/II-fold pyridoxal phosphate-dependent enzyme [bacterium]|nr:aminotransferase class I/II-fold pyridoxal phosphate-dependent enzyme [bacterium]
MRPSTAALHADRRVCPQTGSPLAPPLVQASVFAFPDLERMEEVFAGQAPGHYYSREGNPNTEALARVVAALEGTAAGVACGSGMAAILAAILAAVGAGEHVVSAREVYGGTRVLLAEELARLGIATTFVPMGDPGRMEEAVTSRTRVIFVESLSNPTLEVAPLPDLVDIARRRGLLLCVDNTFSTPVLLRPAAAGAGFSLHSGTKYLSGHEDVTCGVVCGPEDLAARAARLTARLGASLDPFAAWLALRGLRTLPLRVERQSDNALELACWLQGHARVTRVYYPGLPDHPGHGLARTLMGGRFGGMLSFELAGGSAAAAALVRRLHLISLAPSLGGIGTTVSYPLRTSHRNTPPADLEALGITPGLIRLSVGIEAAEDLKQDLEQALAGIPG